MSDKLLAALIIWSVAGLVVFMVLCSKFGMPNRKGKIAIAVVMAGPMTWFAAAVVCIFCFTESYLELAKEKFIYWWKN